VQEQTGIPYALLDGRFDAIAPAYRKLGELTHRQRDGRGAGALRRRNDDGDQGRGRKIPRGQRPRVYYARGPRGWRPGSAARSTSRPSTFLGAQRRAERKGGLAIVPSSRCCCGIPMSSSPSTAISRERAERSGVGVGRGGARWSGASVAENAVRLGRFSALGEPADRAGWLAKILYPEQFPEDIGALTRDFYRRFSHVTPTDAADRACAGGPGTDTLQRCPVPPPRAC
jgi:iron complex transport system substrate-binding protein